MIRYAAMIRRHGHHTHLDSLIGRRIVRCLMPLQGTGRDWLWVGVGGRYIRFKSDNDMIVVRIIVVCTPNMRNLSLNVCCARFRAIEREGFRTKYARRYARLQINPKPILVTEYNIRKNPNKHWRKRYAWGFFTPDTSIFRCRDTRSGDVALEVLGDGRAGEETLVVDRYGGYNRFGGNIQYCYAHLKRDTEDIVTDNPDSAECKAFADEFVPMLSKAMGLRKEPIDDDEFLAAAATVEKSIRGCAARPARHPAVQHVQNIFREKERRLFLWAHDREVPAENNRAERELRPLVIARKTSFGSQSEKGRETREILMSVLNTLAKRSDDALAAFTAMLDALVENPSLDVASQLFGEARCPVPD